MLEFLTVMLNVPKLVTMMRTHFNIFFRRHFPHDHNTTTLLWARPVRPVYPETGSCSSPDHSACSRDKPADSLDHPTLYSNGFKMVLFRMFCLDGSHDTIYISCISKTTSLLERHQKHHMAHMDLMT